jgi:hypothetical protein
MIEGEDKLDLVDPDLLPPQIRCLVKLIGMPDTLALLRARGGLGPTYIPVTPDPTCALAAVISRESLDIMCERYGRDMLDLPKPDKVLQQLRNHYINEASRQGAKSGRQLAAETGLTWRMIKKIKAQAREECDRTGDLFALDNPAPSRQSK